MNFFRFILKSFWITPSILCTAVLALAAVWQKLSGHPMPFWTGLALLLVWIVTALGYVFQLGMLKRFGGLAVLTVTALILTGALMPKSTVGAYPSQASARVVHDLNKVWDTLSGSKDLFTHFSPKEKLLDYGHGIAHFDVFRSGRLLSFALYGLLMGVCFLFTTHPGDVSAYVRQWALVFAAGTAFALQVELLQVIAPSREVTVAGMLDGVTGMLIGLVAFTSMHVFYVARIHRRPGDPNRFNVLGVGVDAVDMGDCLTLFSRFMENDTPASAQAGPDTTPAPAPPFMTSALGVAGIMAARRDPKLCDILNDCILNAPDGMPLVWLGRLFGFRHIERVYGPDLLREVCAASVDKGWKHFFYGAAPGVVEKLQAELEKKHPGIQIVGTYCPPFRPLNPIEESQLIAHVNRVKPDIFWIGISTPQQLYFMHHIRSRIACRVICPVGYAFDVNAGVEKDAPDWIKAAGLQWLHRALKQPRLWKRYLPDNPAFMWLTLAQLLGLKRYPLPPPPPQPFHRASPPLAAKVKPGRVNILGVGISTVNMETAVRHLMDAALAGEKGYVCVTGVHGVMESQHDEALLRIHNRSLLTVPDGMPLVWEGRRRGHSCMGRVYGPDLMARLLEATARETPGQRRLTHFYFGAIPSTLERLQHETRARYPGLRVVGTYAPPFRPLTPEEEDQLADQVAACKPDFFWVGLSTPKQERFMARYLPRLQATVMLGVGAAFDLHACLKPDAPAWIKACGLQWFHRLCQEPRRLWRRYGWIVPSFLFLTLAQRLGWKQYPDVD